MTIRLLLQDFLPRHPFDTGFAKDVRDENLAPYPRTRETIVAQLCEYYGLITHLDEQIGRILDCLDRRGLAENTIVVFAADSGLAIGSHGLLGKQSVYEHSMKAPLIIADPRPAAPGAGGQGARGQSTESFTYLFDLFPTILGWAGTPAPAKLAGRDLGPILRDPNEKLRDSVFLPFSDLMRSIRDERFKLIVYPQINHRQLFDLAADPDETRDLSRDPAKAATIERLHMLLRDWQTQVGDKQPLTVEHPRPMAIRFDDFDRRPDAWQPEWIVEKYFQPSD